MSYQSAGVLPYTVIDHKTYFIFGKDKKTNQWSDFGGRKEAGDQEMERNTAARECFEEFRTIIEHNAIRDAVINKSSVKLCEQVKNSTDINYLLYVTDFRKLAGDTKAKVNQTFQNFKNTIIHGYKYNEKTDLTYVPAKSLKNALKDAKNCFEVRVKDMNGQEIHLYPFTAKVLSHMIPPRGQKVDNKIRSLLKGMPETGYGNEFKRMGHGRL